MVFTDDVEKLDDTSGLTVDPELTAPAAWYVMLGCIFHVFQSGSRFTEARAKGLSCRYIVRSAA